MAQHGFQMSGHGGGAIDPNDLAVPGHFQTSVPPNYNSGNAFSSGSALFGDDELLEGLNSPTEPQAGMQNHGQDFGTMNDISMSYPQGIYGSHHGLPIDQHHVNGFSSTPDGDPIQSPFVHNFGQYRQIQHPQSFGGSLQSPLSYAGSPLANSDLNDNQDPNFLGTKARAARMTHAVQRKPSGSRGPLTPKAVTMSGMSMPSEPTFGSQPIRTTGAHHEKSHSGQWIQTPGSLSSFPGSGFSSPLQANLQNNQINDIILKGGASMPAKLGATSAAASSQEARRKRRRESHNLVERRRRDNINERIQDLSKLVPAHRLEDEKIRKAIQNGTPLSPTLAGVSTPSQATSALAGPGARRAAGGTAGNITTGLPIEEKDKGPNKGDILNGAVSWTRDLMWMLHLKIQQQEELINALYERGGQLPFELTDDERRMQTELMEAMARNDDATGRPKTFTYSRTAGSGLRVPHHTDYKGEPLNGNGHTTADHRASVSPGEGIDGGHDMLDSGDFLDYDDDGSGEVNFKEEDEYGMDLTT
ncbi:Microphthalmia-associated transcription factor [Madurella mycetomatis]|uniref:Microphthalmia-associated transcription factor n=1 Tax=Madurella mycetomatis TaxID=100816 RepID=A0A175W5S8_9PEZI|nr:Microphthalmia-associated transcription factor [Madurella mycetomatis]